jgi:hypothetical protein
MYKIQDVLSPTLKIHVLPNTPLSFSSLPLQVTMSYLEIYNEQIRDLLAPDNGHLDLRDDSKKGIHVAGLSEINASSTNEASCKANKLGYKQFAVITKQYTHTQQSSAEFYLYVVRITLYSLLTV